jgi:hypothetical protein
MAKGGALTVDSPLVQPHILEHDDGLGVLTPVHSELHVVRPRRRLSDVVSTAPTTTT